MNSLLSSSSSPHSTMNFTNAFSSNPSKKIKLTIIPPMQLFVNISSDEDITTTPSPTTTSSSLTPPNAPSQPQPQPPIMGHPLFYNYHDYHGSTYICCSHNRNLFFTLRDEMNIMFAHLEYLLTTAITSHFPPPP
ncbi:hypothetical protein Tco_1403420 [Tanacetum coccineum]